MPHAKLLDSPGRDKESQRQERQAQSAAPAPPNSAVRSRTQGFVPGGQHFKSTTGRQRWAAAGTQQAPCRAKLACGMAPVCGTTQRTTKAQTGVGLYKQCQAWEQQAAADTQNEQVAAPGSGPLRPGTMKSSDAHTQNPDRNQWYQTKCRLR